jgi:enamine deaminase RidA (YjgF/YER057c/UK114 family)
LKSHGYSLAIRVGSHIFVSGTTATDNVTGTVIGHNDSYAQTIQALGNIEEALRKLGPSLNDIVRTKIYVVNIKRDWEKIGKAHAETIQDTKPAGTMIEVSNLISSELLVEIEADAIANESAFYYDDHTTD